MSEIPEIAKNKFGWIVSRTRNLASNHIWQGETKVNGKKATFQPIYICQGINLFLSLSLCDLNSPAF